MISKYKQLDLDDAEAGMVLSTAVLDHQGSVLLPAGAALTEALLTSMRRRGIDVVQVIDAAVSTHELDAERERVDARLAQLFRRPGQTAADAMLRTGLNAYRNEALQ
jgi:hypothetical protein